MTAELIANMRARMEKCRYLASMINDAKGRQTLLQMAEDMESDIRKLEAEEAEAKGPAEEAGDG
jgi:hypothetical protein